MSTPLTNYPLAGVLPADQAQESAARWRCFKRLRFPHIQALDGVRGLAAMAVLLDHLFSSIPPRTWSATTVTIQRIFLYGGLGVDLFFVLSGYLITTLLLLDRREKNYYRNFYWKRFFRIIPALALVLGVTWAVGYTPGLTVLVSLLFVANFVNLFGVAEIGPYWSLAIEEHFYLLWPTVVRHVKPRTMVRVLYGIMIVPAALRVLSVAMGHGRTHYTFVHCDGLAWGALLALLAFRARIPWSNLNGAALWRNFGRWLLGTGLIGMTIVVLIGVMGHQDFGFTYTVAGPLFTGVLAYLITHREAWSARLLGSRPLRLLGDISYMFYLSHVYFAQFYDRLHPWPEGPVAFSIYERLFAVLGMTLIWSVISLYAFERPIGRLRRYFVR